MRYHFIGIGGIGMSGIAHILLEKRESVTGSDLGENDNTHALQNAGAIVFKGHHADNIAGADVVVCSSAIKPDNPELQEAQRQGIKILSRAQMLADVIKDFKVIAVSGSHGKTTTTALIGAILDRAGLNPTVINGGIVNSFKSNVSYGSGHWCVIEADESDRSFLEFSPDIAVVTNIDYEHVDNYKSFDDVKQTFDVFLNQSRKTVICTDDAYIKKEGAITCGLTGKPDYKAIRIEMRDNGSSFQVDSCMRGVFLALLGQHNIKNALLAIAVARELNIGIETIKSALADFKGVDRRFTLRGYLNGAKIIDDYAHHPAEVEATILSAKQTGATRVVCVFQPHRYSRLSVFMDDFAKALSHADSVIILPVYSAQEKPIDGINSGVLAAKINAYPASSEEDALTQLTSVLQPGDIVLCMGAGSIHQWSKSIAA